MNRVILAIFILSLSVSIFLDSSLKVYGKSPASVSAVKGISDLRTMNSTEGEQKVSLGGEWNFTGSNCYVRSTSCSIKANPFISGFPVHGAGKFYHTRVGDSTEIND
jgi:hypothetical protein